LSSGPTTMENILFKEMALLAEPPNALNDEIHHQEM
jgi:hypothetical protein